MILLPWPEKAVFTQQKFPASNYSFSGEWGAAVPVCGEFTCFSASETPQPIKLTLNPELAPSAYSIKIDENSIKIVSGDSAGAYYALCTLEQMVLQDEGFLTAGEIQDKPGYTLRGYSDDISRGQISTVENFKEIILRLSRMKYNTYFPYIEDTFAFRCLPDFGKYSDPVPPEEWRELVAFSKEHFVKIIPIINILGHWDKNGKLEAFSDLMLKDENGFPMHALDVRNMRVQEMTDAMLKEAAEVFGEAGCIHVGGDEAAEYTMLFSKEQAAEYYCKHFSHASETLKKSGCSMMMYSDMFTPVWGSYHLGIEKISAIPSDTHFMYWDYAPRKGYPNLKELAQRNLKFSISPATFTWNRFLPHFPIVWENISAITKEAHQKAEGTVVSSWCDGGMTLREENWFGILVHGEFAWNPSSGRSYAELVEGFFRLFYGLTPEISGECCRNMLELMEYDRLFLAPWNEADEPIEYWFSRMQQVGEGLFREFWRDAREDTSTELREKGAELREIFQKALSFFGEVKPALNPAAFRCFLFDLKRSLFTIKKIQTLKLGPYRTRDEARGAIPHISALRDEVIELKEENRELWFLTNRQSEWEFVEAKYLDLIDTFNSLLRYCKVGKSMNNPKIL